MIVSLGHSTKASDLPLTHYVNPFIGTAGDGNVFPGADYPYGMLQWSPDTNKMSQGGGYNYKDSAIQGFSLTHFSGRYFECYEDFPFMPTVGPLPVSPGSDWSAYNLPFTHAHEASAPGYYSVLLDKNNIQVDLTVTRRTGLGRFTFQPTKQATILINAGGSAPGDIASGTGIEVTGPDSVAGYAQDNGCGGGPGYRVYFAARFAQPFSAHGTWQDAKVTPNADFASGSHTGAYLVFDTTKNQSGSSDTEPAVLVKVAISYVSIDNALLNLKSEATTWDFETARDSAAKAWNARLNSIQVAGGNDNQRSMFYTALYHATIHPNVTSDVNGDYIGYDGARHTMPAGHAFYQNQTSWDNYRTLMHLNAMISPDETADMVQSVILSAQQDRSVRANGGGLPRWMMIGGGSRSMHGDGQDIVIATAYAYGVKHFDTTSALALMLRAATQPEITASTFSVREDLINYLAKGYVPEPHGGGSASLTLELASDDFAIAQFARALGDSATYNVYLNRAQNWKNLWDAAASGNGFTGYIVPRHADGSFISGFDPASGLGFREACSAQATWMVPFDEQGLIDRMGGDARTIARLDFHFAHVNTGIRSAYAYMGNEVESEVPYGYTFAGAPYKTQDTVRRIINRVFTDKPDGLPGNDDGGAMGSWAVFSMMGLYPEIPGVAGYVVSAPFFPSVTIHIANGHTIQIDAPGANDATPYISGLSVNGVPNDSSWLPWSRLSGGATLGFTLSSTPDKQWASAPQNRPPSFDPNPLIVTL